MDKSNVIRKFQNARLNAWIGDYDEAEKLYDEIENSDERLAYILKPTVRQKKSEIDLFHAQKESDLNYVSREYYIKTPEKKLLFNPQYLDSKENIPGQKSPLSIQWKYTVSVIAKSGENLRLEIRGYNPQGKLPKLNLSLVNLTSHWNVIQTGQDSQSYDTLPDLVWLLAELERVPLTKLYIAVDRWGLLSGSLVCLETSLGDSLGYVHSLISELDDKLW